jgi:hypothetical protein
MIKKEQGGSAFLGIASFALNLISRDFFDDSIIY